uniref:Bestrophin homolog n=1 Tax=Panagrellus redivivus TaxID=6233 RepID=A0A7E5A1V6_PANRE
MPAEWFKFIEYPIHGASQVLQIVIIVFLTTEFLKKKSDLQQAFYYVLYISYFVDSAGTIAQKSELFFKNNSDFVVIVRNMLLWYSYQIPGILELMMAFNRCTAIAFPSEHFKVCCF